MKKLLHLGCTALLLLATSCATKPISSSPEKIKNIDKEELQRLFEMPLCIAMSYGTHCGTEGFGNILILAHKVLTGESLSLEELLATLRHSPVANVTIEKLSLAETLLVQKEERIGDEFYRIIIPDEKGRKGFSFIFGVRNSRIYVPWSVIVAITKN